MDLACFFVPLVFGSLHGLAARLTSSAFKDGLFSGGSQN